MHVCEKLLNEFFTEGKAIRRTSWPTEDYIVADGAEGGTIWYYNACEDELTADFGMNFHDLTSEDWEIIDGT